MDFSLIAYFRASLIFYASVFSYKKSCGDGTLVSNSYLSSCNFEYLQLTLGMDFAVAGALDQFLPNSKDVEEVYWTLVTVNLA